MTKLQRIASISDLRERARKRLPRSVFDFIDGGAGAGHTRRANQQDFEKYTLLPRVGVDVSKRDLSQSILGVSSSMPLILAPTGLSGLYYPKGEILTAKAAHQTGIPFCLSTNSVASMETISDAVPSSEKWFQLYFLKDKGLMSSMLTRAKENGYRVLCITLDLPIQGKRDQDIRNGFTVPLKLRFSTLLEVLSRPTWTFNFLMEGGISFGNFEGHIQKDSHRSIAQHIAELCDASADWNTIHEVIEEWNGPVVIKGILDPEDAKLAIQAGAHAIVVSNHGGRQLDQVPSSISALPKIAETVAGNAEIILDSGVTRGTDIAIALSLGANACMIGRSCLWGLATDGQTGILKAIEILRQELDTSMALLGVTKLHQLKGRACLEP